MHDDMKKLRQKKSQDALARFASFNRITDDDVARLIEQIKLFVTVDDVWKHHDDILKSISQNVPAITGTSRISCEINGPVWLHNLYLEYGVVFGCGALVLPPKAKMIAGSIIWLKGGQIVRTMDELADVTVGNIDDD